MMASSGPLLDYEKAFLRSGSVLVRDYGQSLVIMWLTARKGR